ncbi:g11023 [Coccomyxa elongata]
MVMKTDKEQRLLSASKTFDSGLSRFNLGAWDDVLSNDVTLHKDGVTLMNDLHGRNSVKGYFQAYIDRYNYEHVPICGAVDEHSNVAFSFHVDKDVTPKKGHYQDQQAAGHAKPSSTLGIFFLRFDHSENVRDIFFLRQLSHDEAARKLKTIPDYSKLSIDDAMKYRGSEAQSEDRARKHDHAASIYNHIWATGDVSLADSIFAKDVSLYNLVYGGEKEGLNTFKSMVSNIFKEYEVKDNRSTVAVSAGDKAFIFWRITGEYKGDWTQNYGLSLLVFNSSDKIQEVLTFMTPFPTQRRELLKAEE